MSSEFARWCAEHRPLLAIVGGLCYLGLLVLVLRFLGFCRERTTYPAKGKAMAMNHGLTERAAVLADCAEYERGYEGYWRQSARVWRVVGDSERAAASEAEADRAARAAERCEAESEEA